MQTINHILCAADLSDASDRFLSWSVEFCSQINASLSVFHAIVPPRGSVSRQIEFERGGEKEEKIRFAREKINQFMGGFEIEWDFFTGYGDPVIEMNRIADTLKPDLVIAASLGISRFQQFFIGSVVGRMAQTFLHPLLVIPRGKIRSEINPLKIKFEHITMACSLLSSDAELRQFALIFSEKFKSRVRLVHVMESPLNEQIVESTSAPYDKIQLELGKKISAKLSHLLSAKTDILRGIPGEQLAEHARLNQTDLIIAGGDVRPGRIITSTTASLLRNLPCAVLVVPVTSG